jgi:hypothetical protein
MCKLCKQARSKDSFCFSAHTHRREREDPGGCMAVRGPLAPLWTKRQRRHKAPPYSPPGVRPPAAIKVGTTFLASSWLAPLASLRPLPFHLQQQLPVLSRSYLSSGLPPHISLSPPVLVTVCVFSRVGAAWTARSIQLRPARKNWSVMGRAPCCDKASVKKGPWSPEEDAKLKAYIEEHGTGSNWIALPQKIGKWSLVLIVGFALRWIRSDPYVL